MNFDSFKPAKAATVSAHINAELHAQLQELARIEDRSVSYIVAKAAALYVADRFKTPTADPQEPWDEKKERLTANLDARKARIAERMAAAPAPAKKAKKAKNK